MSAIRTRAALWGTTALVALIPLGCAKQAPEPPRDPFRVEREDVVTGSATVTKVDMKTREVTLRGEDGRVLSVVAGPEVRNLPQVKVGDVVVVRYYEAVAAEMRAPTEEERENPRVYAEAAGRAAVGAKPGAAAGATARLVGTISAIDMTTLRVTLKDPNGEDFTVQARDPSNVAKFKVGDPVVLTYVEAVAISVEPAAKR